MHAPEAEANKKKEANSSRLKQASEPYTATNVESKKGYTAINVYANSFGISAKCTGWTQLHTAQRKQKAKGTWESKRERRPSLQVQGE